MTSLLDPGKHNLELGVLRSPRRANEGQVCIEASGQLARHVPPELLGAMLRCNCSSLPRLTLVIPPSVCYKQEVAGGMQDGR
jgi:hypothetical protein